MSDRTPISSLSDLRRTHSILIAVKFVCRQACARSFPESPYTFDPSVDRIAKEEGYNRMKPMQK